MKHTRVILILIAVVASISILPAVYTHNLISNEHQAFIHTVYELAHQENQRIAQQRQQLLSLYAHRRSLSRSQQATVTRMAKQYRLNDFNIDQATDWQSLLERVNTLPTSLVIAQAINESAWGTSRFAKQGNNLFGIWCYTKGCGLVPLHRTANQSFEVKKYPNLKASVSDYFYNINTNSHYEQLRVARQQAISHGHTATGQQLASHLTRYSALGDTYTKTIDSLITDYQLESYPQKNSQ